MEEPAARDDAGVLPTGGTLLDASPQEERPTATVTVFIVDDHELVRRGLRHLVDDEADLVVVGEASTLREARSGLAGTRPDVVVVDARLPDGHGIALCREVAQSRGGARCVVLTSYDDEQAMLAMVAAGASAFLLKQVGGFGLLDAIRRVAAGEVLVPPDVAERARTHVEDGGQDPVDLSRLTRREQEVLTLLAQGGSNREIADRLGVSEKTVKNHVSGVLAKLGLERRSQVAALLARRDAAAT